MPNNESPWVWNRPVVFWCAVLSLAIAAWPMLAHGAGEGDGASEEVAIQANTENESPVAEGEGTIPQQNLFSIVKSGGALMIPIVICSFILFLFVFERSFSLRRRRIIPKPFVKKFLHQLEENQLDREEALDLCDRNRSPVAKIFAAGVKKWGRPAVEVEQAIIDAGERAANTLRRYLRLINGVATVCPLLGLLGTVVGMIKAFNDIAGADAMGRPELLASGISQALLTTAAGLTVAIPALIFYMFFLSRVDRLVMDLDALGQRVVAEISAEAETQSTKRAPRKKAA